MQVKQACFFLFVFLMYGDIAKAQSNNSIQFHMFYQPSLSGFNFPVYYGLAYERYVHEKVSLRLGTSIYFNNILGANSEHQVSASNVYFTHKAGPSIEYESRYFFGIKEGFYLSSGLAYRELKLHGTRLSGSLWGSQYDWETQMKILPLHIKMGVRSLNAEENYCVDFFVGINKTLILSGGDLAPAFLTGNQIPEILNYPVLIGITMGPVF
jgi:hypothetical protein